MRLAALLLLLPLAALAQDELNSEAGLVGRWLVPGFQTVNGATPTRALDASSQGNHGACSNAPIWVVASNMQALSFNGSNQYVRLPSTLPLTTAMSVSGWFNFNPGQFAQPDGELIAQRSSGSNNNWDLSTLSGKPQFVVWTNSAVSIAAVSSISPRTNEWTHICGTAGNGVLTIYINGRNTGTAAFNGPILNNSTTLALGQIIFNGSPIAGRYYDGKMRDVKLFNRCLNSVEAASDYLKGIDPK